MYIFSRVAATLLYEMKTLDTSSVEIALAIQRYFQFVVLPSVLLHSLLLLPNYDHILLKQPPQQIEPAPLPSASPRH